MGGVVSARYDLAIVGSGSAAFAAAIAARRRNRSVLMVEAGTVGGTCVNSGCVPSKALLAAARSRRVAAEHRFPGVPTRAEPVDFAGLAGATRDLVDRMRTEKYVDLAAEYGWQIVHGFARFCGDVDAPTLEINGAEESTCVEADQYVIATGARPWAPPVDGLADAGYLTSTTAMRLATLPTSMVVLGANAVGLEMAQLFARLDVDVTIVEARYRLAPFDEPEVSAVMANVFADEGIAVVTGATVRSVRGSAEKGGYRLDIDTAEREPFEIGAERLLVATGRRPATRGLRLDRVGVQVDQSGAVVVDEHLRTTNPRIWAAGDVTGGPQFVYVAAAHGSAVVANAFGAAYRAIDYAHLPRVTFTSPAIATVGLSRGERDRVGRREPAAVGGRPAAGDRRPIRARPGQVGRRARHRASARCVDGGRRCR